MLLGAGGLFCHVVGLTFAARQEAYDRLDTAWPLGVLAVPLAGALWAALGNVLIAAAGSGAAAPLAVAAALCFPLPLALQRVIPGT